MPEGNDPPNILIDFGNPSKFGGLTMYFSTYQFFPGQAHLIHGMAQSVILMSIPATITLPLCGHFFPPTFGQAGIPVRKAH